MKLEELNKLVKNRQDAIRTMPADAFLDITSEPIKDLATINTVLANHVPLLVRALEMAAMALNQSIDKYLCEKYVDYTHEQCAAHHVDIYSQIEYWLSEAETELGGNDDKQTT